LFLHFFLEGGGLSQRVLGAFAQTSTLGFFLVTPKPG
jgi:hypothetical protein